MPDPKKLEPGVVFDNVDAQGKPILKAAQSAEPETAKPPEAEAPPAAPPVPETPEERSLRLQNHLREFRENTKDFSDDELTVAVEELEKQQAAQK